MRISEKTGEIILLIVVCSLFLAWSSQFGTNMDLVGNYTVNVQQNKLTNITSVKAGFFQVQLTDKASYQRTFPVSLKASGYASLSPISIDISLAGASIPGYPETLVTDSIRSFAMSWTIPANVSTGLWTVSLSTAGTVKPVPDTQTFIIYPTNVTISQLSSGRAVLERTGTQSFTFTASYLSRLPVKTGSAILRVTESDGTTSFSVSATYSPSLGLFNVTYRILPVDEKGIWVATINPREFDDGYGNGGPSASAVTNFTVIPATLSVMVSTLNETFGLVKASRLRRSDQSRWDILHERNRHSRVLLQLH